MRQITQQLALEVQAALQACRHMIEGARQLAQLVLATTQRPRSPPIQTVTAQGIGLGLQLAQRRQQQTIQRHAQQQAEQQG